MAAAVLLPYSVDAFNGIPDLASAEKAFQDREGDDYIQTGFTDVFLKHNAANKFKLVLLHRHGSLNQGQALVATNGTSVPWNLNHIFESGREAKKWDGAVFPTAWLVRNGRLMPYEFAFDPARPVGGTRGRLCPSDLAFVQDFLHLVQ